MYELSFIEAITKCLNNEGFIKGINFGDGVYIKNKNNTLIIIDGSDFHKELGNLPITKGIAEQTYKLFSVANPKEIN